MFWVVFWILVLVLGDGFVLNCVMDCCIYRGEVLRVLRVERVDLLGGLRNG